MTVEGVELIDDQGRDYLDAASGVGVTCLGYGVDEIVRAMVVHDFINLRLRRK
jgi:adenosylmethionine-8-amino-7-oxononanoate aminotransferase